MKQWIIKSFCKTNNQELSVTSIEMLIHFQRYLDRFEYGDYTWDSNHPYYLGIKSNFLNY